MLEEAMRRRLLWLSLLAASIGFGLFTNYAVQHDQSGLAPPWTPFLHIFFPGMALFTIGAGVISWRDMRRLLKRRNGPTE
jgi:hypothetical protein